MSINQGGSVDGGLQRNSVLDRRDAGALIQGLASLESGEASLSLPSTQWRACFSLLRLGSRPELLGVTLRLVEWLDNLLRFQLLNR